MQARTLVGRGEEGCATYVTRDLTYYHATGREDDSNASNARIINGMGKKKKYTAVPVAPVV